MNYRTIVGLEIHVELATNTKMFCRCSAQYFGAKPNTHTCPVCLGLPGALPYPNRQAIEWCIMLGLALKCKINTASFFERKNYFYPDLPKGFQTSQYLHPFGEGGYLDINVEGKTKRIGITRVHMEEDTGKNTHTTIDNKKVSLLDFNRSGVPLVEIVTEPDISTPIEAKTFLWELQKIIRYLSVSDADMDKGNMRLEPNISLQVEGKEGLPNYKVEVKNINSFRFVEKAIEYEQKRQKETLEKGETPAQETRGWDENRNVTKSQRSKEEAHDYRYFPEPDLPPFDFTEDEVTKIESNLPELPQERLERFVKNLGLPAYDAEILTRDKELANFFEEAVSVGKKEELTPKQIANEIINKNVDISVILPAELVSKIKTLKINISAELTEEDKAIVQKVIEENPTVVNDYKSGKTQVIGFLIGQVRKHLPTASAQQINSELQKALK